MTITNLYAETGQAYILVRVCCVSQYLTNIFQMFHHGRHVKFETLVRHIT